MQVINNYQLVFIIIHLIFLATKMINLPISKKILFFMNKIQNHIIEIILKKMDTQLAI